MPNSSKNIAGREVQRIRMKQGLSQEALAAQCQRAGWDISRATLSKIEAGLRCVSDVEIVLLAHILKCTPGELLTQNFRYCLAMSSSL